MFLEPLIGEYAIIALNNCKSGISLQSFVVLDFRIWKLYSNFAKNKRDVGCTASQKNTKS